MRFIMLSALLMISANLWAKDELKVSSCAVRASFLESSLKDKISSKGFDLNASSALSNTVAFSGLKTECPKLDKSNDSNGLVVIGMLVNKETIKVPLTDLEAILAQNCDEPIEVQSVAKLCIYEVASDGSSRVIFEKKKEFAANVLRVDSEVKNAARKWLSKQIPECQQI